MTKYRIKQYPEDTFVVQYKGWFFWRNLQKYVPIGQYWYTQEFANIAQAQNKIRDCKAYEARLAFKPVYHEAN